MSTLTEEGEFLALIVDDDAIVRRMLSFALHQEGFRCDPAIDGEHAVAMMRDQQYDLLITDLQMPNKHGHSLVVDVLAYESRPKIIVHTSIDDPRLTKDLMVRGVDDVVHKPTNYQAFAAKARGLAVRARTEHQLMEQNTAQPTTAAGGGTESALKNTGVASSYVPVGRADMMARLSDVSKVQPVSHAALDVATMVRSDSFDAEQVASRVEGDSVLSTKLLNLANSPFYNPSGAQITDIKQAIMRIGQKRIGEFALATSTLTSLVSDNLAWMDLNLAWRRSVAAGLTVELLVAKGHHTDKSEGLLFSALMHLSGRMVLGTHYPERYKAMVESCVANHEALLKYENKAFPETHARVMCGLLADWDIPAEIYQPLEYAADDYDSISALAEPMRTKAELLKMAIFISRLVLDKWESWDSVELPPRDVVERLNITSIGAIIEQVREHVPGIVSFGVDAPSPSAVETNQKQTANRQLAYCDLSEEPYDFLAEIVPSMGITLEPVAVKLEKLRGTVLVNRVGAEPSRSMAKMFANAKCNIVFVRSAEKMMSADYVGKNISVPCSYAALQSVCWNAASSSSP